MKKIEDLIKKRLDSEDDLTDEEKREIYNAEISEAEDREAWKNETD